MKTSRTAGAFALGILIAACGEQQPVVPDNDARAGADQASHVDAVYSASGTATAMAGEQITISHGPVQGLNWPALMMTFRVGASDVAQGISTGDRIAFDFIAADGGYTLTSVRKAR